MGFNEEFDTEEKRNNSLTFMLIGIIILFIVCRIGELGISIFELVMIIREGSRKAFPDYIRAIISINTLLLVCSSIFLSTAALKPELISFHWGFPPAQFPRVVMG